MVYHHQQKVVPQDDLGALLNRMERGFQQARCIKSLLQLLEQAFKDGYLNQWPDVRHEWIRDDRSNADLYVVVVHLGPERLQVYRQLSRYERHAMTATQSLDFERYVEGHAVSDMAQACFDYIERLIVP